jgi:CrcB protein
MELALDRRPRLMAPTDSHQPCRSRSQSHSQAHPGALSRYGLDGLIARRTSGAFPWGTFVINVSASFLLGLAFTLLTERYRVDPWLRSGITIGFLGAYTTFSTLSLETYRLLEDGAYGLAFANAAGSFAAGLLALYVGVVLGRVV